MLSAMKAIQVERVGAPEALTLVEVSVPDPKPNEAPLQLKSSVLAVLTAALLILATEPFLFKAAPPSEFRLKLTLPVLANLTDVKPSPNASPSRLNMDTTTLLIIIVALLLLVASSPLEALSNRRIAARQPGSRRVLGL